jgi:hypothetical protein
MNPFLVSGMAFDELLRAPCLIGCSSAQGYHSKPPADGCRRTETENQAVGAPDGGQLRYVLRTSDILYFSIISPAHLTPSVLMPTYLEFLRTHSFNEPDLTQHPLLCSAGVSFRPPLSVVPEGGLGSVRCPTGSAVRQVQLPEHVVTNAKSRLQRDTSRGHDCSFQNR